MERFPVVLGISDQYQSVTLKLFILMGTRTCSHRYCTLQLWWHSVSDGLGDLHGVRTYGYIKKWEDLPLVFERSCQNQSVTPKPFYWNGYKNLLRYIRNITIMVAFRNKWFGRPIRGPTVWIYQEMGRFSYGVRAQLPNSKCYTKNV